MAKGEGSKVRNPSCAAQQTAKGIFRRMLMSCHKGVWWVMTMERNSMMEGGEREGGGAAVRLWRVRGGWGGFFPLKY
jgi:hypothetical protein